MMRDNPLWAIEEGLWLEGAEGFAKRLGPDCLMAFPQTGLLQGGTILERLRAAPRWDSVEMDDRREAGTGDVVVLGYVATGRRGGAAPYRALCTSCYRRMADGWKLLHHHQTPHDRTAPDQTAHDRTPHGGAPGT